MNTNSLSLRTDLSFLLMTVLIFFGYVVSAADYGNIVRNGVFMCVTMIVILFAYFMEITATMTVCAISVLLVSGYMAYSSLRTGTTISIYDIFWVLWIPAITVTLWFFMKSQRSFRKVSLRLSDELNKLSGTDSLTQFKNTKAFINDCTVYMKISKRYKMDLCIVVFQLRYFDTIKKIIGKGGERAVIRLISQQVGSALRSEDSIFITNQKPYNWCILMYTTYDKLDIIRNRISKAIDEIDLSNISKDDIPLELAFGEAQYDSEQDLNVMEFLNAANLDLKKNIRNGINKKDGAANEDAERIELSERK